MPRLRFRRTKGNMWQIFTPVGDLGKWANKHLGVPILILGIGLSVAHFWTERSYANGQKSPLQWQSLTGLLGRKVSLPPLDDRGLPIQLSAHTLLLTMSCTSYSEPSAVAAQLKQIARNPVILRFVGGLEEVPDVYMKESDAFRILTDNSGALMPSDLLFEAPQAVLLDQGGAIIAMPLQGESIDNFLSEQSR